LLLHSTRTALFARFLNLLTPSCNAFGSTASFISRLASWEDVFGSSASPTFGGQSLAGLLGGVYSASTPGC
jgi:RecA/RadA recombinase